MILSRGKVKCKKKFTLTRKIILDILRLRVYIGKRKLPVGVERGKDMFDNLRTALQRKGISVKQYADVLCVGEKTVQNKLAGRTDFTYPEFRKTCALLFEYNADYLFAENKVGDQQTERAG